MIFNGSVTNVAVMGEAFFGMKLYRMGYWLEKKNYGQRIIITGAASS